MKSTSARGAKNPRTNRGATANWPNRWCIYLTRLGFTHVEFLPVAEHAFYPSWGYQVTGFFAPTSRFGTPEDFQFLVNALHAAGIGVIVDWVPAHFPRDEWALAKFDGTALFEHEDPRKGAHQDWGTLIFNFGRNEVSNFLVANALFWCERFHIDGLRVDAVASMLYLDYSRKEGQWIPNQFGGRENLEAIEFLKKFNHITHTEFPGRDDHRRGIHRLAAGDAPALPRRTRFLLQMEHGLDARHARLFQHEPVHRKYHQNDLTFAMLYHHNENFVLPLSHDEVVHGKGSLIRPDARRRLAEIRQPPRVARVINGCSPAKNCCSWAVKSASAPSGTKMRQLDWWLLDAGPFHRGLQQFVADLNQLYAGAPGLWQADYDYAGFNWIDCNDRENSVLSFLRQTPDGVNQLAVILNLTPVPRPNYRIGLPRGGQMEGSVEQRRGNLRRQQPGKLRRRHGAKSFRATASNIRRNLICHH